MEHCDLIVVGSGPGHASQAPKEARTGTRTLFHRGGRLPHRCPALYAIFTNKRGVQRP